MSSERWNLIKGLLFISPWLVGFVGLTAVPVVLSFYYSFCDFSLLQPPAFVGLDNYRELAGDPVFWTALKNTAVYAAFAMPGGMILALAAALLLNADISGRTIYRTIVFLPSLVPLVASAMIWLWLFNSKLGLINAVLRAVGISNPPGWLTDTQWAMPAIILMSLWGVGNTVVIFLAGLQDVPRELYEAAELDGANRWQQMMNVTLPMLSPVIFFNLIMAIIGSLQVFAVPFIMTGGGPARATYFYTMYLYDNAFTFLKMGYASAMAWVQLLIVLGLTGIAFWSSRHWVHYQGK
jgi:multiple sugar transport system permease protein